MAPLTSRIDSVTPYQSGAAVRRLAELWCAEGRLSRELEQAGNAQATLELGFSASRAPGVQLG